MQFSRPPGAASAERQICAGGGCDAPLPHGGQWSVRSGRADHTTLSDLSDDLVSALQLGKVATARMPSARVAIVSPDQVDHAERYARCLRSSGLPVRVFSEMSTGCGWLGVDHEAVRSTVDTLRTQLRETGN